MKKVLSFLFLGLLAFLIVGCDLGIQDDNKVYLTISDADKTIALEVGDSKQISVSYAGGTLEWLSSDESVISVEGGTLKALKAGSATVTLSLKDNDEHKVTISVTVTEKVPEVVMHTVIFIDSNTGEVLLEQAVEDGKAATAPEVASENFAGWDKEFNEVKEDLIIMTIYEERTISKISYMLSGGSWAKPEDKIASYVEGVGVELATPVKDGYSFAGWTLKKNDTAYITSISKTQKGDVTLYANWKEKVVEIEFDFNGGASNELFLAQKEKATATLYVDNYNYNGGAFWSSANYEKYSFIGQRSSDPGATFSDRIYIAKDNETGFYKIVRLLANGTGSSWPDGGEYVITVSSSYKAGSGFSGLHAQFQKLGENPGQYIVFDGDFTQASLDKKINVYIFTDLPETVTVQMKKGDKLFSGLKILGGTFTGWADPDGNMITSVDQITADKIKLTAQYDLDNPVTAINVTTIPTEMLTGETSRIVASVEPANAYFKQIFYSSSNTDILDVNSNGLLTAKSYGTATITLLDYVKKIKVEKEITVYPVDCIDVEFVGADGKDYSGVLKVGGTVTVKPVIYGKSVENATFSYTSSNPAIATVSAAGLVTAVAAGSTTIKISSSAGNSFELNIGIVVNDLTGEDKVDKVLALIAQNNFAVVEAGNISLMDNGTKRLYVSTYGSVNRFLFDEFKVDDTYKKVAIDTINSHAAGYNCKLRTDWHGGIEFVTVHDTATTTGTVQSIGNYMATGETSIHYTVGDDQILAVIPEEYIAYHAGDGTGTQFKWYDTGVAATDNSAPDFDMVQEGGKYYFVVNGQKTSIECPIGNSSRTITNPSKANFAHLGPVWKIEGGKYYMGTTWVDFSQVAAGTIGSHGGNNNSIGIEMCVNEIGDIYDTWQRTAQLVADICIRNNLDLTRVKQHNTWTGKNCPQCLIAADYWWGFMKMVEVNYEIMKNYSDVKITMTPSDDFSKKYIDSTGRVIKAEQKSITVSYDVTVECGGTSKTITLYSVIPGLTTWTQMDGVYSSKNGWKWGVSK